VILVSTRGGRYANTPLEAALDYQEAYLMAVLSFIGITDVSVIRAESTNLGVEARAQAIEEAKHNIHALVI
jgi:FMN-dependent NADH-azoreductase